MIEHMPKKGGKSMTNQEILTKAIEKAVTGGFNFNHWRRRNGFIEGQSPNPDERTALIFNHDFAKALWGEKPYHHMMVMGKKSKGPGYEGRRSVKSTPEYCNWQHHLQQMVIAYDPIAYLGEHM